MNRGDYIDINVIIWKKIQRKNWNTSLCLLLLCDDDCNLYTITSKSSSFREGEYWQLQGKVKKQKIFSGRYQTHIVEWKMTGG
jgi:hypothetical protein